MRMDTVDDFIYRRFGDQIYKNIKHHLERVSEELEWLSYSLDNTYSANERFKYIKANLHLAGSELTVLEKTVSEFKG